MSRLLTISVLVSLLHVVWLTEIDLINVAVFPPVVPDVEGEPRGHLKPFGHQRPPEGPIKEYTEPLNANDFWDLHVKDHIPLVYRGYIKDSPAIAKWNDEYLAETYGDLDVLVEHKLEDRTSTSGRMRLADFLKNYKNQDMYIVSMFPSEMMHQVRAIPSVLCGTFREFTHESNFWMSAGGTRSVVHYDADHNIHCMLAGRKDFMMINNNITTKTNLYYKKKDPNSGSGFSFLDPDIIDMHKFKRIAAVPWTYATLYPGDCIFIPSKYIHQVRGYGRTIAITTLFTADVANNFNGDGCTEDIMKKHHTMAEIPFQWTYKKGDPTIDMGYMNVELVKERFREMLTDPFYTKTGKISKRRFASLAGVFSSYGRNRTKIERIWTEVFGFSDDYKFDAATIELISLEHWKVFCRAIEAPHGVVTDGSEPVFVKPGQRQEWEREHGDDDEDMHMTEREKELQKASNHDPMLHHLSKEEKKEYLKQIKEKKAKYGTKSKPVEEPEDEGENEGENEDEDEDEEVSPTWESEVTWSLDELPEKYQEELKAGKIPLDFKNQFMESLSDVVKAQFKDDFEKNIMPRELLREMGGEVSTDEDEPKSKLKMPYSFWEVGLQKQRQLVQGKIPQEDIASFITYFPDHRAELEKGILPTRFLRGMIGSDTEQDFEEDIKLIRKKLSARVEL